MGLVGPLTQTFQRQVRRLVRPASNVARTSVRSEPRENTPQNYNTPRSGHPQTLVWGGAKTTYGLREGLFI
jgi:hypothetical protein